MPNSSVDTSQDVGWLDRAEAPAARGSLSVPFDFESDGKRTGSISLVSSDSEFGWQAVQIPVGVVKNGAGPTLTVAGGTHGDEPEGPVAALKLLHRLQPDVIRGRVIVLPALNLQAVEAARREAPSDGLDLNRAFPGDPAGSIAQVTASFVDELILPLSDIMLDIHSGGRSMHFPGSLWLLECADAEMMSRTLDAAGAFGAPYTIVSPSLGGDMSEAAARHDCLYLSTELSGGGAVNPDFLAVIERGIDRLIVHLGMVDGKGSSPVSTRMMAVKGGEGIVSAPCHGLFEPYVCIEHRVRAGEPLGCIHSVIAPGNAGLKVLCPVDGMVYGLRWPAHVRHAERIAIIATDD